MERIDFGAPAWLTLSGACRIVRVSSDKGHLRARRCALGVLVPAPPGSTNVRRERTGQGLPCSLICRMEKSPIASRRWMKGRLWFAVIALPSLLMEGRSLRDRDAPVTPKPQVAALYYHATRKTIHASYIALTGLARDTGPSGRHAAAEMVVLSPQHAVHRVCRLLLHVRQDTTIDAERHGDAAMARHLAHHLDVDPACKQQGCCGAAEVVETDWWQISPLE